MLGKKGYDSQDFLDTFTKTLVSQYEIEPLLQRSAATLAANLQASYAGFYIRASHHSPERFRGTSELPQFSTGELHRFKELLPVDGPKLIGLADLTSKQVTLRGVMEQHNIALIARLAADTEQKGGGYLLLGIKKNKHRYTSQDLAVLEIATNELVIATQNALRLQEIEHFAATLQQKVDQATHKLRSTNEKLRALDEAKDDFVSMASHQLRTPLTSIKGYTSMVLEGDAGKITATQRQLLEQTFISSQRMVYLIADLLNVSRIKTGKFTIDSSPVNLADVVAQEVEQLKDVAKGRKLKLNFKKPAKFPELMLDETKTRQVIMNFIDNAIYYTPAGGEIKVELLETSTSVELRVTDDGIGVPRSEQPHLFTKFYRAGNARTARPDGTGLGLFMAKKVIIAEGGAVLCHSEEGKGSTFGFIFPKHKLAPPAAK